MIRRFFPAYDAVRENRSVTVFGPRLRVPDLWHLNRRSVAGAFAVGLFVAFLPIPMQMLVAATIAILVRVNLPISVLLVWVSNPLTMPPIFYTAYTVGRWILDEPQRSFRVEWTVDWFTTGWLSVWKPLLTGSLVLAVVAGVLGYLTVRVLWWIAVMQQIRFRRLRFRQRLLAASLQTPPDGRKESDS